MNIKEIINEVINESIVDDELNQYRTSYNALVPWEIDKRDVSVINRFREQYAKDKAELYLKSRKTNMDYESALSNLYDNFITNMTAALWRKAQA